MSSSHVNAHVTEGMKLSNVGASLCPAKGKKMKKINKHKQKAINLQSNNIMPQNNATKLSLKLGGEPLFIVIYNARFSWRTTINTRAVNEHSHTLKKDVFYIFVYTPFTIPIP